jgi:pyruvate/2-oxoacid:ferredoxin oxidoreductase alpha subunit
VRKVIKGNHAVAEAVRLCGVQVISAFPITPQTSISEELAEMCARGELEAAFIRVESEHSALASLVGASTAGVRTFTATSSHGLLYMHEVLHWAAGAQLPIVMVNVNRAVGAPWNIWADQTDAVSQRDTGWIQIYTESCQEALDNVILAYKLAESVSVPVMLNYDAFFLSHTSEVVDLPDRRDVEAFLPAYRPAYKIDLEDPRVFGVMMSPDFYYEQRYVCHSHSCAAVTRYPEVCGEFRNTLGRSYDLLEAYRTDDAEIIVVSAGTITSVARLAVEQLRRRGKKVGLMKIRLFRPVPAGRWREVLGGARKVAVIDRNLSPGLGGVFAGEVQAALYPLARRPVVYPFVAGLGGRDVTPEDVGGMIEFAESMPVPEEAPIFWGLKQ